MDSINALSPLDGRYCKIIAPLRPFFSESAYIRYRIIVEVAWLKALSLHLPQLPAFSPSAADFLDSISSNFTDEHAARCKELESVTNHDVKAIEYFMKEQFRGHSELQHASEFIHFACTSEDANNVAQALMISGSRSEVIAPRLNVIIAALRDLSSRHASQPMMARTHGQPATPTTLGKELSVFAHRLQRAASAFQAVSIRAKMNGATGNFSAHAAAAPHVDWRSISRSVIEAIGLEVSTHTTQIEPHDYVAELFMTLSQVNTIMIDMARDMWGYISLGYFKLKVKSTEVGSSTMPHKVNPIDFENCEGNLGLANALLLHMAQKLPISRFQRDLSDSTVLRNVGAALGYCLVAYESAVKGLSKLEANSVAMSADLDNAWELLAEPVQTVMRLHGVANPYEKLKEISRGHSLSKDQLHTFIKSLDIPEQARSELLLLTPSTYVGLAEALARE